MTAGPDFPPGDRDLRTYRATVRGVTDGDTLVVDIDQGLGTWRLGERVRLVGIDAPDRPAGAKADARRHLKHLVDHGRRQVVLTTNGDGRDRYFRLLALVHKPGDEVTLNQRMVEAGHARLWLDEPPGASPG